MYYGIKHSICCDISVFPVCDAPKILRNNGENGNHINILLPQGKGRHTDRSLLHRVGAASCSWSFLHYALGP